MSQIDYDTEQEANEDIERYLNHYGDDYPQLYEKEVSSHIEVCGSYEDIIVDYVTVIYNAPWPVESYG